MTDGAVDQVRVTVLPDGRVTRQQAALYIGVRPQTLAVWSIEGRGPKPIKIGRRVFYQLREIDAFIAGEPDDG